LSQNDKIRTAISRICWCGQGKPNSAFGHILFQLLFSLGLINTDKLYYCQTTWLKIVTKATAVDGNMMVWASSLVQAEASAGSWGGTSAHAGQCYPA